MRRGVLIFFFGVHLCAAENRYISPIGSDAAGNGTEARPWATFSKAGGCANSGDVIQVAAGSYDQEPGNTLTLSAAWEGKSLVFQPALPETVTLAANANQTIGDNGCRSGSFTFNDIEFTNLATGGNQTIVTLLEPSSSVALTFNRCKFQPSSLRTWFFRFLYSTSPSRALVLSDCTFNAPPGAATSGFFTMGSYSRLVVTGCIFNWEGCEQGGVSLNELGNTAGATGTYTCFTGNTFNCDSGGTFPSAYLWSTKCLSGGTHVFRRNTAVARCGLLEVPAALGSSLNLYLEDNKLTCATDGGDRRGITIGTDADTSAFTLGKVTISGNTLNIKGPAPTVAMFLGSECRGAYIHHNVIRGQNFWNGMDLGMGIYLRGCANCTVSFNDVLCRSAFTDVLANGANVHNNTFYATTGMGTNGAAVNIRDSNGSGSTDTKDINFVNNICVAAGAAYAVSFAPHDASMDISSHRFEGNLYYNTTGEANLFYAITSPKTLPQMQDYWHTLVGACMSNDSTSLASEPGLMNPAKGDLCLKCDAPGRGRNDTWWHDLGAWQVPPSEPSDVDHDGRPDFSDNCPLTENPDQADDDADGVGNACDHYAGTTLPCRVGSDGCCLPLPGDFDHDGDVDQEDFGIFQACWSGPGILANPACMN